MYYMASCSFRKDSLAMVLRLIEEKIPLNEVVFYDTGMEFSAVYNTRDKVLPILEENGIKYTELKPDNDFLYDMLERPVKSKQKGKHNGYGWCGGVCRWGTSHKLQKIDKYAESKNAFVYIGIASDETKRIGKINKPYKLYPLCNQVFLKWNMSEKDCLQFCYDRGFAWEENGINLYDILDRVSCWCCCNKNKKELYNIYKYLPEYWDKLKYLQSKIQRSMKNFHNAKYGDYGNVFDMEKVFSEIAKKGN